MAHHFGNTFYRNTSFQYQRAECMASYMKGIGEYRKSDQQAWMSVPFNQKNWKPTFIPLAKGKKEDWNGIFTTHRPAPIHQELRQRNMRSFCPNSGKSQYD